MNTVQDSLVELGLSSKSAAVYLAILQLGSGTVQAISLRAGIVRTTCYPLLEDLQQRRLVSTTRSGKKTIYVAESPEVLQHNVEKANSLVRSLVPALAHILSGNSKRPKVEVYEGVSGVWRVYEDVIQGRDYEVKAFLPSDEAVRLAGDRNVKSYIRKRVSKNISMRALMQQTPLIEEEYGKYNKGELREAKFIDAKKFPIPVEIDLYPPNNIAITSFQDGTGLIIRSDQIHTAFSSVFELLWEESRRITPIRAKQRR